MDRDNGSKATRHPMQKLWAYQLPEACWQALGTSWSS